MVAQVMLVVASPPAAVNTLLDAISGAGGGIIGEYSHCAFTSDGFGRFKPSAQAAPHIGDVDQINQVPEVRIETFCERANIKKVVQAIRQAHPYEEPVIYIIPLLSEEEL